jgi:uncharacterized protein YecT (DUF1311 family)
VQVAAAAPPPPPPAPVDRLEVLAPAPAEPSSAKSAVPAPPEPPPLRPAPPPSAFAAAAEGRSAPPASAVAPDEPIRPMPAPTFDCSRLRSRGEAMVCADPRLAALDSRLERAYRTALASGRAPPDDLAADQDDWLAIREQAARISRGAVASIYRQRIDELEALSGEGPP